MQAGRKHTSIEVEIGLPEDDIVMSPDYELAAYRITQECLNNIPAPGLYQSNDACRKSDAQVSSSHSPTSVLMAIEKSIWTWTLQKS